MIKGTSLRLTPITFWNLKAKVSLKSEILCKNLKTHPTSSQKSQAGAR